MDIFYSDKKLIEKRINLSNIDDLAEMSVNCLFKCKVNDNNGSNFSNSLSKDESKCMTQCAYENIENLYLHSINLN